MWHLRSNYALLLQWSTQPTLTLPPPKASPHSASACEAGQVGAPVTLIRSGMDVSVSEGREHVGVGREKWREKERQWRGRQSRGENARPPSHPPSLHTHSLTPQGMASKHAAYPSMPRAVPSFPLPLLPLSLPEPRPPSITHPPSSFPPPLPS